MKLIDEGKIANFLFDHYSAKAMHQKSTGHAAGGPTSLPTVGTHSQVVAPGEKTWSQLLADLTSQQKSFLLVNRYSGQTDPVTGDFSGVAKGSEWWSGGEFQYCVKETLIAGNVYDCLGSGLSGISAETQVVDSSEESPTIICDGVSVTA